MTKLRATGGEAGPNTGEVIAELRMTNRLLAVLATRGLAQKDAVLLLDAVGMSSQQIATALGANPSTVRVALHRARKARDGRTASASPRDEGTDGED